MGRSQFSGVVRVLIFINIIAFILQMLPVGPAISYYLGLNPMSVLHGQVWRLLTYGFLHSTESPFHILFNMYGLWIFGSAIEELWGEKKFLFFYLFAVVFSGLISLIYPLLGSSPLIIGASGGLLGILTLYAIYYPDREMLLFFIIPVKARIAAIIFAVVSIGGTITGGGGVAHLTHLGGIAAAFVFLKIEPKVLAWVDEKNKRKEIKESETTVHFFESRKSRQEEAADKEEVDDVLRKITAKGIESLSENELRILEKASGKPIKRK